MPQVRVIRGEDQIGILPIGEALEIAADALEFVTMRLDEG